MAATYDDVVSASYDAALAVLKKIQEITPKADREVNTRVLVQLAEAYAWLFAPAESHGGGVKEVQIRS